MARKKATPADNDAGASSFNRASRREWNQKKKDLAASDNPEREPEARDNSLFGDRKRSRDAAEPSDASEETKKKPQKHRQEVLKEDPAVALARKSKAAAKSAGGPRPGLPRGPRADGTKQVCIYNAGHEC